MILIFRTLTFITLFFSLLTGAAAAEKTTFMVSDSSGKPLKDAVVTVAATGAGPIRFDWPLEMTQVDLTFDPYVLVVPVGADVKFPNLDKVRHHVYSFSKGNKFELKLFGKDESRSVKLEKAGVAAIGCNIHDMMVAYIRVVDTPYAAKTGADGKVTLDLPAGAASATVWHPDAMPGETKVALPASRSAPVAVTLKVKQHEH
ncbi:MAG: methylamine utilization protein [Hyphomonas sp.]